MNTVQIGVRLPKELYDWLNGKAENEHRTMSNMLISIVIDARCKKEGHWKRKSDEEIDDRYECSNCGCVVHYKDAINLYQFNSWCGCCGSYNGFKVKNYL